MKCRMPMWFVMCDAMPDGQDGHDSSVSLDLVSISFAKLPNHHQRRPRSVVFPPGIEAIEVDKMENFSKLWKL